MIDRSLNSRIHVMQFIKRRQTSLIEGRMYSPNTRDSLHPTMSEAPFSRDLLLQEDDQSFIRFVSSRAQQFAVLGYTDVAKRLVSQLNGHARYRAITLQTLWFLWASLGEWPTGEEEKMRRKIEKRKKEEGVEGPVTKKDMEDELQRMEGVYADTWFYKAQKNPFTPVPLPKHAQVEELESKEIARGVQDLLDAVLEQLNAAFRDSSTGSVAMDASAWLVSALDLRCLLKERRYEDEGLISIEDLMERFSHRMASNQQIVYLTQCRRAWGVMKDGVLARAVRVNDEKVQAYAKLLEEALEQRMRDGRMKPEPLSMKQMLEALNDNTRTNPDSLEHYLDEPPESLFHDPATPQEIKEVEEQLGIELPADYKEFLAITDGFEATWGGIIPDSPLYPVGEIRWFDDDEDYFIDLTFDPFGTGKAFGPLPTIGKAIEIGTEDIDNVWLLPPSKVREVQDWTSKVLESDKHDEGLKKSLVEAVEDFAGSVEEFMKLEWFLVTWASGGAVSMEQYPSFTAFTREKVERSSRSSEDALRPWRFFGYQCC